MDKAQTGLSSIFDTNVCYLGSVPHMPSERKFEDILMIIAEELMDHAISDKLTLVNGGRLKSCSNDNK